MRQLPHVVAALGRARCGGLVPLHRLALWAESRGWICYRTRHMPAGAAGPALLEVTSIVDPQVTHVIEGVRSGQVQAEPHEAADARPGAEDGGAGL